MTAPDPQDPALAAEAATAAPEEPSPPPEPWTPERVLEWNRYYDLYVAAGVLLLVLVGSIHPVADSSYWSDLQTGRLIAAQGPVTRDPFSYTMADQPWVDIPWLFQAAQAQVFDLAARFGTADPDQTGTTVAIILNALVRVLTALVLLQIRRPGPGGWWVAVCAALALGGILMPYPGGRDSLVLPVLGGIAGPATLDSSTWGILLLAIELWLLVAAARGARGALVALVPLFLVWANVDDSFLIGLVLFGLRALAVPLERGDFRFPACEGAAVEVKAADLAMILEGFERPGPKGEDRRVAPSWWFGALAASAAATLANPWLWEVYPTAANPILAQFLVPDVLTYDQLSFFGQRSWNFYDEELGAEGGYRLYVAYYVLLVGIGLASFALNRRRLSVGRLLVFVFAAALWGLMRSYAAVFAVVAAVTVALNGQEWYQDRYGVRGRLGRGWALWSVGGRAVTLIVIFAMIFKGLTGYGASKSEPVFGVGTNADEFAFEAAEYLGEAPIEGNVLNLRLAQGDALIWKAWPVNRLRRTYIDGRPHLFPPSQRRELLEIQRALADGDVTTWKPLLDQYGITVVMVPMIGDPYGTRLTYAGMAGSEDWIPFYDDGAVVLFGRADAPKADLAYFRDHRLDAELLAFRTTRNVPSSDRVPTPTSWIDRIFQNRGRRLPQPHVWSAQRWLTIRRDDPTRPPDLAHCLLAIGQARAALARDPDDPAAWNVLGEAYRLLSHRESEILQAAAPATQGVPTDYLRFRLGQRMAVLNFAIQSTPPPTTIDDRVVLAALHQELADLYLSQGLIDLARDQLVAARELLGPEGFSEALELTLARLDEQVAALETELLDLSAQQADPIQVADVAIARGAPGLALRQLDEAEAVGINPDAVKSRLVDLYCQVGMPDKALELLSSGSIEDPALSTGAGTASYRQGLVYLLIGSYDLAATLWRDRALPQLRGAMVLGTLEATRSLLRGLPREASDAILEVPAQLNAQATWEYQLGLCLLEAGEPEEAGEHLRTALELKPDLAVAPLLRAYLEQLGVPVPEPEPRAASETEPEDASAPSEDASLTTPPAPGSPDPDPAPSDPETDASPTPEAGTGEEANGAVDAVSTNAPQVLSGRLTPVFA